MSITQEQVREHLLYNPETGVFTRLTRNHYRWKVGEKAGCVDKSTGYVMIRLFRRKVWAHRLVFLYLYGAFPPEEVDHRNGDRVDNRIANLRLCSGDENKQNLLRKKKNKAGFQGVTARPTGQFVARLGRKYLGIFGSPEEARDVYLLAKRSRHEFQPVPRDQL